MTKIEKVASVEKGAEEVDAADWMTKPDEPIHEISLLGGGLKLRSRKTVELTDKFAEQFLEKPVCTWDRGLEAVHVTFLSRHMDAGTFRWEQANLITCLLNGQEYRMNGQHTCWARIYADPAKFKAHGGRAPVQILHYEAETEDDMRQLYATIDRGKVRHRGQVVVSYLAGREQFDGLGRGLLRKLASGLAFWLWEEPNIRGLHSPDEVSYLLLTDHYKTAIAVGGFLAACNAAAGKHLLRQPVMGAMFATFDKLPQVSKEFWPVVYDGLGVTEKRDLRYMLRNYLMLSSLSHGKTELKQVSSEEMYRGCLLAWSNWRANKSVNHLQPSRLERRPEVK